MGAGKECSLAVEFRREKCPKLSRERCYQSSINNKSGQPLLKPCRAVRLNA